MKEIVFYKKMDIILRYRSVPADVKDQIQKTFREEAERQTEKEKASNLIDIIFFKLQNQFDISIFKKEAINYGFFKNLYQIISFSNMYVLLSIAV
ncbi:hypothetical protein [Dorea longicatena]|uniref:hypothetical protein n=1 Tax=Dorea longicatena TaxID=88431 RepID=UPI0022E444A5|nr:hypothetical protein [Dorea longicatena]